MNKNKISHLISTQELPKEKFLKFFKLIKTFKKNSVEENRKILANKIIAMVFFQPSTRTKLGFQTAILKLGAQSIGFANIEESRCVSYCNESWEDCIKVISCMADAIILRHFITNAAITASRISSVPIINAGDGLNEHPVQAINDLWVIYNELNTFNNITVGIVGDPNGRVLRSFIFAITKFNIKRILFLLPISCTLGEDIKQVLTKSAVIYEFCNDIKDLLSTATVIEILPTIVADLKKQNNNTIYSQETPNKFIINREKILSTNSKSLILHPGPRSDELNKDCDFLPNSMYFKQVSESIYVRMALLTQYLSRYEINL